MRLVCPNCGAQYEVDDRVIPDGGRDVQCSNCGHAWFQRPANWQEPQDTALAEDAEAEAETPDVIVPAEPDEAAEAEVAAEPVAAESAAGDGDAIEADEDAGDEDGPAPDLPRRPMDNNVREILEQEAERELQARAQDPAPIESQPELGITDYGDPEEERRRIARERMARMRGIEDGETTENEAAVDEPEAVSHEPTPEPARNQNVFPDIDEINSSLDQHKSQASPVVPATEGAPRQTGSSGFRRGFSVIVLILAVLVCLYIFAPQIVGAVPSLEPAMVSYVDAVNNLLTSIDTWTQGLIKTLEDMAGEQG